MVKRPKRPRDPMQLAKLIGDIATGQRLDDSPRSAEAPTTAARRKGGVYNFARIHKTLRVTPAMEAGVADHVWSLEEIAKLAS
jgi:hypothetical protein